MINNSPYTEALNAAITELTSLMGESEDLESRHAETKERIAKLRKGIAGISLLAGEDWQIIKGSNPHLFPDSIPPDIGMTDAVRKVMQSKEEFFSPVAVRTELQKSGYDLAHYKNVLASIHTILKRLTEAGEVRTDIVEDRTVYKWNRGIKMFRQGTLKDLQHELDKFDLPSIGPAKK